jgi:hypothetical protein
MVMAACQCIRTRGVIAEVYHASSKVCITIGVGYGGFERPLVCHSGERVHSVSCENALDRDLNLSSGNMFSSF